MFRAIKRLFIWMGLMAEKATETDAINQAVVERGIRDSKAKADKAHYANGQLAGQIALLKDQTKRQDRQRAELQSLLQAAAAANDASTRVERQPCSGPSMMPNRRANTAAVSRIAPIGSRLAG